MTGRREADRDIAEADRLAIAQRLQRAARFLAKPALHDGERLGCGQDAAGVGPGGITMTMGDDRARHRAGRIDVENPRRAIQPLWGPLEPKLRGARDLSRW